MTKTSSQQKSRLVWIAVALIIILSASFIAYTMINPPSAKPSATPSSSPSSTPTSAPTETPTSTPTSTPTPTPTPSFMSTVTYTVWLSGNNCSVIDRQGFQPSWSGGTNATYVIQSTLDAMTAEGGILHVKAGIYSCHFEIPYTAASLIVEGEGMASTVFVPDRPVSAVITRQSEGPYPHRIILRDFSVNCTSGTATDGIDLSDIPANESPKDIFLYNIEVQGHSGYGIKMNHNDNSVLSDCIVENPHGAGKCLQWNCTTGGVKLVRGFYHPGDCEVAGQSIIFDTVQLSGVRVIENSQVMHLINPSMPNLPVLSTHNFIETSGCWLGDLKVDNPVVTLDDGDNFVAGNYANTITITNPKIYITAGSAATMFPSHPTLTSRYYSSGGPFAAVSISGGGRFASPSGTVNLIPADFTPGVNIVQVEHFDGRFEGNMGLGEEGPGGELLQKAVTLPIPYCDGDYVVYVEQAGNMCWASDKTSTGFNLNYNVPGGFTVSWVAIHT